MMSGTGTLVLASGGRERERESCCSHGGSSVLPAIRHVPCGALIHCFVLVLGVRVFCVVVAAVCSRHQVEKVTFYVYSTVDRKRLTIAVKRSDLRRLSVSKIKRTLVRHTNVAVPGERVVLSASAAV